jgi:hypothetical protein
MRYLKKELLLIVIVIGVGAGMWFAIYIPTTQEIERSRATLVELERELETLLAGAREVPLLEKEITRLSERVEHLRIEERLTRRSPLYIMSALSELAAQAKVEISPIRIVEAAPNWSGFEMTINAPSLSSFGTYIESLFNSHLLLNLRSAIITPGPEGRGLKVELIVDGYTGDW